MNIFNVALVTRAFLFFAYPTFMSGDTVWVRTASTFGLGAGNVVDSYSGATPLGQVAVSATTDVHLVNIVKEPLSFIDGFIGLIPGSVGETSVIAILLGACLLLITRVASWKTCFLFAGALLWHDYKYDWTYTAAAHFPRYKPLVSSFAFALCLCYRPVTSARTERIMIYGALTGAMQALSCFKSRYPKA
jgi:Na+-transporting NADH:ubiquinone oxidoreductase subunit B